MFLSIAIADTGVASLFGSLVMLYKYVFLFLFFFDCFVFWLRVKMLMGFGSFVFCFSSLLFAGLLMNYDRVPSGLRWMQTTSFFHAAYEALLVNELRYLQLI